MSVTNSLLSLGFQLQMHFSIEKHISIVLRCFQRFLSTRILLLSSWILQAQLSSVIMNEHIVCHIDHVWERIEPNMESVWSTNHKFISQTLMYVHFYVCRMFASCLESEWCNCNARFIDQFLKRDSIQILRTFAFKFEVRLVLRTFHGLFPEKFEMRTKIRKNFQTHERTIRMECYVYSTFVCLWDTECTAYHWGLCMKPLLDTRTRTYMIVTQCIRCHLEM
jgi:hypothetical protein